MLPLKKAGITNIIIAKDVQNLSPLNELGLALGQLCRVIIVRRIEQQEVKANLNTIDIIEYIDMPSNIEVSRIGSFEQKAAMNGAPISPREATKEPVALI